jgi:predicted phosphodiesterase
VKIQVLSDLHLTVAAMELPRTDADVVVLAGDIARPAQAIEWARGFSQPVIYVPGNHEYYGGSSLAAVGEELQRLSADTHVHVLDEADIVLGGVRFVCATLWTDFLLFEDEARREESVAAATRLIADFSRITLDGTAPFTPAHSRVLCERAVQWLSQRLDPAGAPPTVVVTHHAPSARSVEPKYADSVLNPAFVSNLDALVARSAASIWIHGHTHYPVDYTIGPVRVFSNPRGYARDGVPENRAFDPYRIVEIP